MKFTNKKLTTLAFALSCSANAFAVDHIEGFKVAIIKDAAGTTEIVDGHFAKGIDKLNHASETSAFDVDMGLCVANLKSEKLHAAEKACSNAVSSTEMNVGRSRHGKLLKALAHSNRGIVRYLKNDTVGAYDDFTSALLLVDNKIIADNLTYFKSTITSESAPVSDTTISSTSAD